MQGGFASIARGVLTLVTAWSAACVAQPAWIPTSESEGSMSGRAGVFALAIDPAVPDHVYAATGNQVFLSVDGGQKFAPLPPVPTRAQIRSLAVLRSAPAVAPRLLVGTSNDGLFASADAGLTYARFVVPGGMEVPGGPLLVPTVWELHAVPGSDAIAFMFAGGTTYRTDDGGIAWRVLEVPDAIGEIATNLGLAPGGNVLYAGRTSGLFKSIDGGTHWTAMAGGFPAGPYSSPPVPMLDPANAQRVTALIPGGGVYRSDNGGVSWLRTGDASFQCCIYHAFASGDTVWAHVNGGAQIHRSRDAGATWSMLPLPTTSSWPVFERDPATGRLFAAASEFEPAAPLQRSADGGDTWRGDSQGLGSATAIALAVDPGRALYAVSQSELHALSGPQALWRRLVPPGTYATYRPILVTGPSEVMTSGPSFWRSRDGGTTWALPPGAAYTGPQIVVSTHEPGSPQVVYGVAEEWGLSGGHSLILKALSPRRSVDGGATWTSISDGLPAFANQLVASGDGRLVAGTDDGVWFSANRGDTWRRIANVAGQSRAIRTRGDVPQAVFVVTDSGVYRSADGGNTFSRASDLPATGAWNVAPASGATGSVYLVDVGGYVFASEDQGATWTLLGGPAGPLPPGNSRAVYDVAVSPWSASTLYAATSQGVLKFVARADAAVAREFHHGAFDHYFMTTSASEAAKLSTALSPDWRATGKQFAVVAAAEAAKASAVPQLPVCRFFSAAFAPRSSHFYTPYADECAQVKAGSAWTYEGIAFALAMPEGTPGARQCPAGTQALYRAYNNFANAAPNHRYTIDAGVLDAMIASGWIMEGELATRVFACVPAQD